MPLPASWLFPVTMTLTTVCFPLPWKSNKAQDGVMRLTGVDDRGVFVKTQAIAQDPQCDTIVVASTQDKEAALQALGNATHIFAESR